MSFTHVLHAVAARSLMDADEVHTFSTSSRNTLIATAAVGKSFLILELRIRQTDESVAGIDAMFLKLADLTSVHAHTWRDVS
jgi:hypothetical protein